MGASRSPLGFESLNIVVSHDNMDRIAGTPLPHMTGEAVRSSPYGLGRGSDHPRNSSHMNVGVTTAAHGHVMFGCLFPAGHQVWVMTGGAGHLTLQEASGLPETIRLMGNLQPVVVPRSRLAIEKQLIVLQWLAWPVGEGNTVYIPKHTWQVRTRCLKVALHAYIHLSVPAQRGRI
jgi:hypothetical protein